MNQPPPGGYPPGNPYAPQGYPPQQQQGYPQQPQQGYPQQQQQPGYGAPAQPPQAPGYPQAQPGQPYGAPQAQPGQPYGAPQAQPVQPYGAPQQPAFGAPGYQPQGQPQAPQQGLSVGGVTLPTAGLAADFSPDALMGAVMGGKGFHSPRLLGGGMMGLSILLTILNVVLIMVLHRYYPYVYSVASIFWCGGLWLVITGQPRAMPDGSPAPMWARIGLGAACVVGILIGIALIFIPWEPTL